MASFQRNIFGFAVLLAAVATFGCRASPWSAEGTASKSPAAQTPAATAPTPPLADAAGSGRPADDDLRQVMAEVRRLGAGNPALQTQLLAELQASEPGLWPLVVESYRSRLAYGQQLRQQEALGSEGDSPIFAAQKSGQSPPRVARLPVPDPATLVPDRALYPQQPQGHPGQTEQPDEPARIEAAVHPSAAQDFGPSPCGARPISYNAPTDEDWHSPLTQAIALLDAQLNETPKSQEAPADRVKLALLRSAAEPSRTSTDALGEAKQRLERASASLAETAPLELRNLAFCRAVESYGSVKRFEKYEFSPGQRLLLYAEVENFGSQQTPRGYHTLLGSSYRIFDGAGKEVARQESTTTEDYCLNRRRDYFIGCDFRLPGTIRPGRHTLVLSVEDLKTGKRGEASIEFTVR